MKTRKWPLLLFLAALSSQSCEEWGKMDPPAGIDVAPRLEQVARITFEDDSFDPASVDFHGTAEIVDDALQAGKVLHFNEGYASMANPLAGSAQNGVSLTFFVQQAVVTDENEAVVEDTDGALFSFRNANATQRMFVNANGALVYEGVDGNYTIGTEVKTGMLTSPGEWHYVAVVVRDNGYAVYVDGKQRIDRTVAASDFDFDKIVGFMGGAPILYIGHGADVEAAEMWFDDIAVYRNQITSAQWTDPRAPSEDEEPDYTNWVLIGAEDNTSGYFAAHTPYMTLKGDGTIHINFVNHNSGSGGNWNNWALAVDETTSTHAFDGQHFFVLRNDNWENIAGSNSGCTSDFDWGTFVADMNGSTVDMKIERAGNTITVTNLITTTGGKVYNYSYVYTGALPGEIVAYLVTDSCHFMVNADKTLVGKIYPAGTNVGATDNSDGYFVKTSDHFVIPNTDASSPFVFTFTNYGSGGGNWNNWVLAGTNGKAPGVDGHVLYFALRADGWENVAWGNGGITNSFNWDTFLADMQGATVRVAIQRNGATIDVVAKIRTAAGVVLGDYTYTYGNATEPDFGALITQDGSHVIMHSAGYMPMWSSVVQ